MEDKRRIENLEEILDKKIVDLNKEREEINQQIAENEKKYVTVDGKLQESEEVKKYRIDLSKINAEIQATILEKQFVQESVRKTENFDKEIEQAKKDIKNLEKNSKECEEAINELKGKYIYANGKMQKPKELLEYEEDLKKITLEISEKSNILKNKETEYDEANTEIQKLLDKYQVKQKEPEETKPEEIKPEEIKPEETKPEEIKPEEIKPEETKPEEIKPEELEPEETEPEELEPEELEPEETEPEELELEELEPEETEPAEAEPEEPEPEETEPEEIRKIKPEEAEEIEPEYNTIFSYIEGRNRYSNDKKLKDLDPSRGIKNFAIEEESEDRNGAKRISEITCMTKLGLYAIKLNDGTIKYFDAKKSRICFKKG